MDYQRRGTFKNGGGRTGDSKDTAKRELIAKEEERKRLLLLRQGNYANPTAGAAPPERSSGRLKLKLEELNRLERTESASRMAGAVSETSAATAMTDDPYGDEEIDVEEPAPDVFRRYFTSLGEMKARRVEINAEEAQANPQPTPNEEDKQKHTVIAVTHLQGTAGQKASIDKREHASRILSRLKLWLTLDCSFREINRISNAEARTLKQLEIDPNLPQFAATHLDPFLLPLIKKVFTVSLLDESGSVRAKLSVTAAFRDFGEAILFRAVANLYSRFGILGKSYVRCGSLSEAFQTPYFKAMSDKVRIKFGEDIKVCPIAIFSDGTHLNSFGSQSIQPIELQIADGYSRHVRATKDGFARISTIVGWVPNFRETKVFVRTKASQKKPAKTGLVDWSKLTLSDASELTQRLQKAIYEYVFQSLADKIEGQVYDFPQGVGHVVFVFSVFKGDQPEKNRWSNSIGCQICTDCDELCLDDSHFRKFDNQGRIHEVGLVVPKLQQILSLAMDPWCCMYPPDLMHTCDNAFAVHFTRIVALALCDVTKNKDQITLGDMVLTSKLNAKENATAVQYYNGDIAVSVPKSEIEKHLRVTQRDEASRKTDRWTALKDCAVRHVGDQAQFFFEKSHSMKDREYGFAGLIFALKEKLSEMVDVDEETQSSVFELTCTLYNILIHLQDSAVGFNLEAVNEMFARCRELWLNLSATVGIVDILTAGPDCKIQLTFLGLQSIQSYATSCLLGSALTLFSMLCNPFSRW